MKNLGCSDTRCWERGRQCGSASKILVMKNLCKSRIKIHRERERERERHKVVMYIPISATVTTRMATTITTNNLNKRLQSHFI